MPTKLSKNRSPGRIAWERSNGGPPKNDASGQPREPATDRVGRRGRSQRWNGFVQVPKGNLYCFTPQQATQEAHPH
jgi:hypothetical protein